MATNLPFWNFGFFESNQNLIFRSDYDSNGNQIYLGWAQPGTLSSEPYWRILQQNFNGSNQMLYTAFPQIGTNPSAAFSFIWDNRASYSYS